MLPPLLLPTLLNATFSTLRTTPTTTTPHPKSSSLIYCWPPSPPHLPPLIPTTYLSCQNALKNIPLGDAGLKPLTFSRSEGAGFTVPHSWESGDCAVEIDVTDEGREEVASFAEILMVGFEVAVECVIKGEHHFGGRSLVGSGGGLKIWVYGFRDEGEVEGREERVRGVD